MSAGMDSTALFHILHSLNYDMAIAHVNFQLRDEHSNKDEAFVKSLAQDFDRPCFIQRFDTHSYCINNNLSIQAGARELRYAWMEKLRIKHGFHCIVTAHHLNDDIETALHHFSRGTGIKGIKAMLPKRDHIVRPLLETPQSHILSYVLDNNISYREDKSNKDTKYTRNALRQLVVPQLINHYPNFIQSAAKSLHHLKDNWSFYHDMIERETDMLCVHAGEQTSIDKDLLKNHAHGELLLYEILKGYGFHPDTAKEVYRQMSEQSGQVFYSKKYELHNERNEIMIVPLRLLSDDILTIHERGTFQHKRGELRIEYTQNEKDEDVTPWYIRAYLSADDFPLVLRRWHDGDRFQPKGMKGASKKVKKYLTDEKCPHFRKKEQLVLTNAANQIIWLPGFRQDHRFTSKNNQECCYKISWESKLQSHD